MNSHLLGRAAAALLSVAACVADVEAQNLYVAAASGNTPQMYVVPPGMAGSVITFPAGTFLPYKASAWEIDQRTGHLMICHKTNASSDIQVLRTIVAGTTVIQQTNVITLPNTGTWIPQYLYREDSGAMLLFSYQNGTSGYHYRADRIGITTTGAVSVNIPITTGGGGFPDFFTDICTNEDGDILMTGPVTNTQASRVYSVPATGGAPTQLTSPTSMNMTYFSLEVSAAGMPIVGGVGRNIGPAFPSLICGTQTSTFFNAVVNLNRMDSGLLLLCDNGVGFSQVRSIAPAACGAMGGTLLWTAPSGVLLFKSSLDETINSKLYGSSCAAGNSDLPVIAELTPPVINFPWTVGLSNAPASTNCAFYLGANEIAPVLLTPFCGLFHSADLTAPMQVTDATGGAMFVQSIPNDPNLRGLALFGQWAVFDATAPNGLAVTSAVATTVQ